MCKKQNDESTTKKSDDAQRKKIRYCLHCNKVARNRCGGCRRVYFCDENCQRLSWKKHQIECVPSSHARAKERKVSQVAQKTDSEIGTESTFEVSDANDSVKGSEAVLKSKKKRNKKKSNGEKNDKLSSRNAAGKTRSKSLHTTQIARQLPVARSVSFGTQEHVTWGTVSAREFKRLPGGGGAIPYDGSWALGLGDRIRDVRLGFVQEMDAVRQEELQTRAKQLSKTQRHYVRQGETRQFDYRRGARNPLFMRLTELERKKIFTEVVRKGSFEQDETEDHYNSSRRRRNRKEKNESNSSDSEDFSYLSVKQLDEFTTIRESRDDCGCSCGDLVKKVSKMNMKKLHGFLELYEVPFSNKQSKPELMALAKKVAFEEKNCHSSRYCECARNEVPCHDSICSGCVDSCSNTNKLYKYNRKHVDQYRKEQLAKWQAHQFVSEKQEPAAAFAS